MHTNKHAFMIAKVMFLMAVAAILSAQAAGEESPDPAVHYEPTWESLAQHGTS